MCHNDTLFFCSNMVASANDITIHRLLIQCEQQLNNVNDWSDGDKSKYALVSHWTLALAPHLCLSCVSFYLSSTFDTCNNPTAGTFEVVVVLLSCSQCVYSPRYADRIQKLTDRLKQHDMVCDVYGWEADLHMLLTPLFLYGAACRYQ